MRKTAWLAIGMIMVIGLSGCGGRRSAEMDQPKVSSVPPVSESTKAPAKSTESKSSNLNNRQDIDQLIDSQKVSSVPSVSESTKAPAKSTESKSSNLNRQDIDQLIDSLNELGDLVDKLDSIDESSLVVPDA